MTDIYDSWDRFKLFFQGLTFHGAIALIGGMIAGFLPAAFFGSASVSLMPPAYLATSTLLGYWVAREYPNRWAQWVGIPGLMYLSANVYKTTRTWDYSWAHESRLRYVVSTYFGPDCSGSECLYVLMVTAPALCTIGYSLGAALSLRWNQDRS